MADAPPQLRAAYLDQGHMHRHNALWCRIVDLREPAKVDRPLARTKRHNEPGQFEDTLGILPAMHRVERIDSHHEQQLVAGHRSRAQFGQRIDGVRLPRPVEFDRQQMERRVARNRQFDHRPPVNTRRYRLVTLHPR